MIIKRTIKRNQYYKMTVIFLLKNKVKIDWYLIKKYLKYILN
jgi:hypothetical protein